MFRIYERPTMRDLRTLEKRKTHDAAGFGQLQVSADLDVQTGEPALPEMASCGECGTAHCVAAKARVFVERSRCPKAGAIA